MGGARSKGVGDMFNPGHLKRRELNPLEHVIVWALVYALYSWFREVFNHLCKSGDLPWALLRLGKCGGSHKLVLMYDVFDVGEALFRGLYRLLFSC